MRNFSQSQNKIKKLSLVLSGVISLGLAACNSGSSEANNTTNNTTAAKVTTDSALQSSAQLTSLYPYIHTSLPKSVEVIKPAKEYDGKYNTAGNYYNAGTSLKGGQVLRLSTASNGYLLVMEPFHRVELYKCDNQNCLTGGGLLL